MKIMNHTLKMLAFGALLVCNNALAQPNRETDAAVQYKNNFMPALMSGDKAKAKKSIEEAKKAIDDAAAHPETQNSPKTFLLRGDIYFGYMAAFAEDTVLMQDKGEEWLNTSLESYKKCLELAKAAGPKVEKKFKPEVKESIYQKKGMLGMPLGMLFEKEKYKEAAEGYELQVKLSETLGETDSTAMFNSALCYDRINEFQKAGENFEKCAMVGYNVPKTFSLSSLAYRNAKNLEAASKVITSGRTKFPNDKDLLLELVNLSLAKGDNEGAEKSLNEAIAGDPNNKQLHYVIGTIYSELKQNEKAETALNKALELDPNYQDALYQLGAHLITWAGDIRSAADKLKFDDPAFPKLSTEADATYTRAIAPLEKYISINSKDVDVLNILSQLYRKLNNLEKANEYKKKAEAAKQ
jgi:tetratricopeptide (TPR) repeat protein